MKTAVKIVTCTALFLFTMNVHLAAQNRYALIIGNGSYSTIERLVNPVNDATDIALKLRTLGYQVDLKTNIGNVEMDRTVNEFMLRLGQNSGNEGFFWFSGYGVQIDGENYLLPVDVDGTDDVSVKLSSYPVARLMNFFDRTAQNKINIVVLDACRRNPFRNIPGNSINLSGGVGGSVPPDLLLVCSTAVGEAAADGAAGKRNSLFTEAFLQHIESSDDIRVVIRDITRETLRQSGNKQRPYQHQRGNLSDMGYYSLNPRRSTVPADQEDATVFYSRGWDMQSSGDNDGAIREFTRAISINPDYMEAYWYRGIAHEYKNEYDQALADYTAGLRVDPTNYILIMNIGAYYSNTEDHERAIAQYNEVIRLQPDYASAYGNRGEAFRRLGKYDEAIADCDTAIRYDANNYFAYRTRGEAYYRKRNYPQAVSDLTIAIKINPDFAWAYYDRAQVYRRLDRNDLADADMAAYNRLR